MNLSERLTDEARQKIEALRNISPSAHREISYGLLKYSTYVDMAYSLVCELYFNRIIETMEPHKVKEIFNEIK